MNRNVLQLPYQVARTPLALVEEKLVKRLPADSPPRLMFERIVGSFDRVAGRLMNDRQVHSQGSRLREHADTLSDAVQLEQNAAERRRAAAETVQEAEQRADTLRENAQLSQSRGVQEAVENERKEKQAATRRARAQATAAKRQADARATSRLGAVAEKRKLAETRANLSERRASADAKADLDAAAEKKKAAAGRRAEAGKLAALSAAERQARKS